MAPVDLQDILQAKEVRASDTKAMTGEVRVTELFIGYSVMSHSSHVLEIIRLIKLTQKSLACTFRACLLSRWRGSYVRTGDIFINLRAPVAGRSIVAMARISVGSIRLSEVIS